MKRLAFIVALTLVALFTLVDTSSTIAAPETTFTVNTTIFQPNDGDCDAELCTLSEAIKAANDNPGKDKIKFNIPPTRENGCDPGTGVCTLKITSALPSISDMTIDGYSQPGATLNTLEVGMNTQIKIILQGQGTDGNEEDGLVLGHPGGAIIKGLALTNFGEAIHLKSDNNLIVGNFIGMLPDGITPHANSVGIRGVLDTNNRIGTGIPSARNLISGNQSYGVWETDSTRTKIQGNYFGTDKTGLAKIGGGTIHQVSPINLLIGGFEPGQGNVIGGDLYGIVLSHYVNTRVINNNIGVGADNKAAIGSAIGIAFVGTPLGHTGHATILGNRIANHLGAGVGTELYSNNIYLTRNSIYNNSGLGFALSGGSPTPNDPKDVDDGSNGLQNFPVLTLVEPSFLGTTVKGKLNSTPNKTFRIELFTNPSCDASGHGEGKNYLGIVIVTTNNKGNANFTFQTSKILLAGTPVTANATSSDGQGNPLNTSEFSKCKAAE